MQNQEETLQNKKDERRGHVRVEGVLPTSIRKIDEKLAIMKCKTIPGLSYIGHPEGPDGAEDKSINPFLMRRLNAIDQKLELLLDNIYLMSKGLTTNNVDKVSICASGIRAFCDEGFAPGDCVEIKILLTTNTSFWVILYGRVTRVTAIAKSQWEVGIEFLEMGDEVKKALGDYISCRQGDMI